MKLVDRNIAINDLERALVPGKTLLDGRSEVDRLRFLIDFASVINFYDSKNEIHGSWEPLLLKDPVFLMASIAKTNRQKQYEVFEKIRNVSGEVFKDKNRKERVLEIMNELFVQLIEVFLIIDKWSFYMTKSDIEYNLKSYVYRGIKDKYSGEFWAIVKLHRYLKKSKDFKKLSDMRFSLEGPKQNKIWQDPNPKKPFWKLLDLYYPLNTNVSYQFYKSLVTIGDNVFDFYNKIICSAESEFNNIALVKDKFPDTLLLRAFTRLMMIHQEQINSISNKHLNFYYRDILKQEPRRAESDHAIVIAELTDKIEPYNLPTGTLFAAGKTSDNRDITFRSIKQEELNPTNILNSYTIIKNEVEDDYSTLYMRHIEQPGEVKKNEDDIISAWNTFGAEMVQEENRTTLGIAFGSPMLYLKEGKRIIEIRLAFLDKIESDLLRGAVFYLSSKTEWLEISEMVEIDRSEVDKLNRIKLLINLSETFPGIEKFGEDTEEIKSRWPLFKIVFSEFLNISNPPILNKVDISVEVNGVRKLSLFNDFGGLDAKAAFPFLGPTVVKGSNFYIGSDEILSKPIDQLAFDFEWNQLPEDFRNYYAAYNEYLETKKSDIAEKEDKNEAEIKDNKPSNEENENNAGTEGETGMSNDEDDEGKIESFLSKFKLPKNLLKPLDSIKKLLSNSPIGKFIGDKLKAKTLKTIMAFIPKLIAPRLNILVGTLLKVVVKKIDDGRQNDEDSNALEKKLVFENENFKVKFDVLINKNWKSLGLENEVLKELNPKESNKEEIVGDESGKELPASSLFTNVKGKETISANSKFLYLNSKDSNSNWEAKPNLQEAGLIYSEDSNDGFIQMTLEEPRYGFGFQLFPEVVSDIALKNTLIIADTKNKNKELKPAPPAPFVPMVKKLSANYKASVSYRLNYEEEEYPIECYYFTPFKDFSIYDSSKNASQYRNNISTALGHTDGVGMQVPLFLSFIHKGGIFIELNQLIYPGKVNLYFELVDDSIKRIKNKSIDYYYLSDSGWKSLSVISDSTNGFSCSGIIKVNFEKDTSDTFGSMPSDKCWMYIGVNDDPMVFAQTLLLQANGIELERVDASTLEGESQPYLNPDSIKSPVNQIAAISKIAQPFSSQGGRPKETFYEMNKRISYRLKSKDRVINQDDYYRIALERFPFLFFVKSHYDESENLIKIYAVKKIDSWTDANAFKPLITHCEEIKIEKVLTQRSSAFTQIEVTNFKFVPVTVMVNLDVEAHYVELEVKKRVNHLLNIYLSPWIKSEMDQIGIDSGLEAANIAAFIKSIEGVSRIVDLGLCVENRLGLPSIHFDDPSKLIVPSLNHIIS